MTNLKEITTAGKFIRQLRLDAFKTQGEMAEACGKTVSYWSALENGKSVPQSIVDFIADYFQLDQELSNQFTKLAAESKRQQKLDMTKITDPDAKDLALAFAKHLGNLDKSQISSIKRILNMKK